MEDKELHEPEPPKRRRGRPKKNGMIDGHRFCRALVGLFHFHEARAAGLKFESALDYAAKKTPCSATELKRTLARYQPREAQFGLVVAPKPTSLSAAEMEKNRLLGLPEVFWKNPIVHPWGIDRVPKYPRINRVVKKSR